MISYSVLISVVHIVFKSGDVQTYSPTNAAKEQSQTNFLKLEKEGSEEESLNAESKTNKTGALGTAQVHESKKGHREILEDPELRSTIRPTEVASP